jgi:hypothetical protein
MKLVSAIACLVLSAVAHGKPIETWQCQQHSYDDWSNILVVATVEEGRRSGEITVAGVTHTAIFQVEGFDRRWDFGTTDNPVRFAFIVQPNGDATYFDFRDGGTAKPSNFMFCRQRRAK